MSVPKRSQAFPERMEQPPFPAFPSVPPLKGEGNVGNDRNCEWGGWRHIADIWLKKDEEQS